MAELKAARRITVVTLAHLEKMLLEELAKLGMRGHTCVHVVGKGRHEQIEDVMTGYSGVRCEMVVRPEAVDPIVEFLRGPNFQSFPMMFWVDDTWVDSVEPL